MTHDMALHNPGTKQPSAFEMKPRTMEEAMRFCEIMADSDLVPTAYKGKPGNILVAIQMGHELGMTPMRALRSIAVINGRASMWGDDMLAMVLASPVCEYVNEADSTDKEGVCRVKRKGTVEHVSRFTLEDAKRAGLLGKQGPWQTNTPRMLKLRARGFSLRDVFADVLAGLVSAEEALDIPREDTPASEPLKTLKERLKAKIENVALPEREGAAPAVPPGSGVTVSEASGPGLSNDTASDAPSSQDDPAEPWRAKLRTAHDSKAVNAVWRTIPEAIKQDCYAAYADKLKSMKGK